MYVAMVAPRRAPSGQRGTARDRVRVDERSLVCIRCASARYFAVLPISTC